MQQYIEEEIIKQLRDPAHQRDAFAQAGDDVLVGARVGVGRRGGGGFAFF